MPCRHFHTALSAATSMMNLSLNAVKMYRWMSSVSRWEEHHLGKKGWSCVRMGMRRNFIRKTDNIGCSDMWTANIIKLLQLILDAQKTKRKAFCDYLDYEDKHYQRRKTDLENHLYKTYDKIDEAEELLVSAKTKKRSLLADKITGDNIYKALIFFDKLYAQMNEVIFFLL